MAPEVNVYQDWLGIKATPPLNHYQLLKLKPFEDNTAVIRKHYRKLNAHVRKYATGEFADQSQDLLNELAKAMLCLTDQRRKEEYDASLGRKQEKKRRRHSLEDLLLGNHILDQQQLEKAKTFADVVGLDLHQAVLQQKFAKPEIVTLAYAESIGLPYIDLDDIGVEEDYAAKIPPAMARQHSLVPVMVDDRQLLVASPTPVNPDVEDDLRMRFEMPVRTVICRPQQINEAIKKHFPRDAGGKEDASSAATKAAEAAAMAGASDSEMTTPETPVKKEKTPVTSKTEGGGNKKTYTILGFNFSFIASLLLLYIFLELLGFFPALLVSVVIAGLVAGIVYLISPE
jgi:hypothetical protein